MDGRWSGALLSWRTTSGLRAVSVLTSRPGKCAARGDVAESSSLCSRDSIMTGMLPDPGRFSCFFLLLSKALSLISNPPYDNSLRSHPATAAQTAPNARVRLGHTQGSQSSGSKEARVKIASVESRSGHHRSPPRMGSPRADRVLKVTSVGSPRITRQIPASLSCHVPLLGNLAGAQSVTRPATLFVRGHATRQSPTLTKSHQHFYAEE